MKPAANSQSRTSLNTNSQPQTFGLPKNEPDSNEQNWESDCSCSVAHGRGVHVKLESGSAQITGKLDSFGFLLLMPGGVCLKGLYCVFIWNRSPTTSSETILHDARILDCVTGIRLIPSIISEIPFRTNRPTIAHQ